MSTGIQQREREEAETETETEERTSPQERRLAKKRQDAARRDLEREAREELDESDDAIEIKVFRYDPEVEDKVILKKYDLNDEFPGEVLRAAEELPDEVPEDAKENRQDLTDLTVITIDPYDAKDLDDAVSVEMTDQGNYRVGVHIRMSAITFVRGASSTGRPGSVPPARTWRIESCRCFRRNFQTVLEVWTKPPTV